MIGGGKKKNYQPVNVDGVMKLFKTLQAKCRELHILHTKCVCVVPNLGTRDAASLWQ